MAYTEITGIAPQYSEQDGWFLKFYKPTTDTPISMATNLSGDTLLAKAELDINGFITTDGTTLFIPFLDQSYDAFLFPTAAEADANDTVNAKRIAKNINPFGETFDLGLTNFKPAITPGQTQIAVPDAPNEVNLIIDGDVQELKKDESDNGSYTYAPGLITLVSDSFVGDERVVVQYGLIIPKTTVTSDGFLSYAAVANMVVDPSLVVGDRMITYMYNAQVKSLWDVVATGAGDLSDGTLLLPDTTPISYARLQIEPVMSVRAFGAYGNNSNDDSNAWVNAIANCDKIVGHSGDNYVVTESTAIPSNKHIDGRGAKVKWRGEVGPIHVTGRDRGVFEMVGVLGSVLDTSIVFTQWLEGSEIYPTNSSALIVDEKYLVVSGGTPPAAHVGYLLRPKVSPSNPATRVQLNYVLGWDLDNVQFTYKKVDVIENSTIENIHIIDETDPDGSIITASGIVMEFAANCHVKNVRTTNVYFPSVFSYFVSDCSVIGCYIEPSTNSEPSGFGIIVQWNNSYRCYSEKLQGRGVRRISDFTASSHCTVIDSGGENTRDGELTTHGEYEHNLYYRNTRGIMSFANSGVIFGETSKNIVVEQHRGTTINASNNVINLSLKDCICTFYNLNSVGLVVDNCNLYADVLGKKNFQINNWTRNKGYTVANTKPAVVMNSEIQASSPGFLVDQDVSEEDSVHFTNCKIELQQGDFAGPANIKMDTCELSGSTLVLVANPTKIELINCEGTDIAFGVLADLSLVTGGVDFRVRGGTYKGSSIFGSSFWANRDYSALGIECKMFFDNTVIEWDFGTIFESPLGARNPEWYNKIMNCDITNTGAGTGIIRISDQQSPMRFQNNTIKDVFLDLDAASATRIISDTIVDT